jgi:tRNA(Ile)-lysidine synthase
MCGEEYHFLLFGCQFAFSRRRPVEICELGTTLLLYHFPVHDLAKRLLKTIRKRQSMRPGDRVAVAVSGGADSVALLCLLLEVRSELGIVLSVAHINHKLRREESEADEKFVRELAGQHTLELHLCKAPLNQSKPAHSSGIEADARKLRYDFFRRLAIEGRVTKIATAHTLDDQAETVLLRLFRGTGIRGLAGIHPRIIFEEQGRKLGEVSRPLLGFRHAVLREYLRQRDQAWREDSSNKNTAFLRNRVRHQLLPLIQQEFGEAAVEHMAELAEIARAEEDLWRQPQAQSQSLIESEANPSTISQTTNLVSPSLDTAQLLALPLATQRRQIRSWIETNAPNAKVSFRLIEDILDLAQGPADNAGVNAEDKKMEIGADPLSRISRTTAATISVRRTRGRIELIEENACSRDYQYILPVPGAVEVPELRARFEAQAVNLNQVPEDAQGQLLDRPRLPEEVLIRNWRAGDRYWPAHSASEKKVKELLTDLHVSGAWKKLWPVAVTNGKLVWMRGFAVPTEYQPRDQAAQAIWIRQIPSMM